jgi:hypothetical protein
MMNRRRKHIVSQDVEQEIDAMARWSREAGIKPRSIHSYSTRFREFAAWFKDRRDTEVAAQDVSDALMRKYEEHLKDTYRTQLEISSRLTAVRRYNKWAVEIGILPRSQLLQIPTRHTAARRSTTRKRPTESVEGESSFILWMKERGRKESTIQRQLHILRSIGRWRLSRVGARLTPETATPDLLDHFWAANKRNRGAYYGLGQSAMHNYALWAVETGAIDVDPFAEVIKWSRRAKEGAWRLIENEEIYEFLEWVAEVSRTDDDKAFGRVKSVTNFFRWYYITMGKKISYRDMTSELIGKYERYLHQSERPPHERLPLAGSTINSYLYSARWFLRWAETKHAARNTKRAEFE